MRMVRLVSFLSVISIPCLCLAHTPIIIHHLFPIVNTQFQVMPVLPMQFLRFVLSIAFNPHKLR